METIRYSLSQNFYSVKYRDIWFCFNSLEGRYAIVNKATYEFFKLLRDHYYGLAQLKVITGQKNIQEVLEEYIKCGLIIENNKDERKIIETQKRKYENELKKNNKIFFIGFTTTDKCNFGCHYCVKQRCDSLAGKNKEYVLRWETAKKTLGAFFKIVLNNKRKIVTIGFTGGEPLLNFKVIKKIVEYTKKNLPSEKKVNFTITTNGALISKEIARFMARNKFIVAVSLDGLRNANNKVRIYKNGGETYDHILQGIENLAKYMKLSNKRKIAVSTCLSQENFEMVDTDFLDFLKNSGIRRLNLEADLIDLVSDDYQKLVRKLFKLYKYGRSIGLTIYGYWSKPFFTLLSNRRTPVAFCAPLRGQAVAIVPEGKIQPCVYINELIFPLDKFRELNVTSKYRKFLLNNWKGNFKECRECEIEGICLGGCYVTRIIPNKEVFKYRCFLNKQITPLLIRHFLETNYEKIQREFSENSI